MKQKPPAVSAKRVRTPKKHKPAQASPEQSFWTSSGLVLSDLKSLEEALRHALSDEEYAYHANHERNDFAKWVEEVLGDVKCAQALRQAKKRTAAARVVAHALKNYTT